MRTLYDEFTKVKEDLISIKETTILNEFASRQGFDNYKLTPVRTRSIMEKELAFLEALEMVWDEQDKNILENVYPVAEKVNTIGLIIDKYMTPKSVDRCYREMSSTLQGEMKKVLSSDDIMVCDKFINSIIEPNSELDKKINKTICCSKDSLCKECFDIEENRKVTHEDLSKAKEIISNTKSKISDIKDKVKDNIKSKKTTSTNLKERMEKSVKVVHGNSKMDDEECCGSKTEAAKLNCIAACMYEQEMIDYANIIQLETQLIEMHDQSVKLILGASLHNPRAIIESNTYLENMYKVINAHTENTYDLCYEMAKDIDAYIEESGFKETLQRFRTKLTVSNDKFLKKYAERAKNSNCKGVVIEDWYEPVDINNLIRKGEKKFDALFTVKNDEDYKVLKDRYKKLRGNFLLYYMDGEYSKPAAAMLDDKVAAMYKDIVVKKVKNHQVTQKDVNDAIAYLKDSSALLRKYENEFNKKYNSSMFVRRYSGFLKTKDEKIRIKIDNLAASAASNMEVIASAMVMNQVKILQTQARLVVLKAARASKNEVVKEAAEIENVCIMIEELNNKLI